MKTEEVGGKVIIFDTTLRDGEQSPGASLDISEKLEIARMLARLGVNVIEAGFPISSEIQFRATELIAKEIRGPVIAGLCRAERGDIDACWKAIQFNPRPRIHTFIATSDIHINAKFRRAESLEQRQAGNFTETLEDARKRVLGKAIEAVSYAKTLCSDVEFSAEDAGRTDKEYLARVVHGVIEAGATTVNIPDTTGYCLPEEFYELISYLFGCVENIDQAVISVHCHNDLGLAVANSIAAVRAGARQVECTINGIGERAGNASLEEVAMILKVRSDLLNGANHSLDTKVLTPISRLVSNLTGLAVQRNKAVVGANAFAHEAGIHQHGVLNDRNTYEIMKAEDVGLDPKRIVLGRHSGKHGVSARLQQLGYTLDEAEFSRVFTAFSAVADRKKEVTDEELAAIVGDQVGATVDDYFILDHMQTLSGTGIIPSAAVRIKVGGSNLVTASANGDGPVDATYKAIQEALGIKVNLSQFRIDAKATGTEAMGEVLVVIKDNGNTFVGRATSTDIIEASALAFIRGLNRMHQGQQMKKSANLD